jgi:hypothetical protein
MPEVVHSRSGRIARTPQTDLSGQTPKNALNALCHQSTTTFSNEEMRAATRSKMSIAPFGVAPQRCTGRRM